MVHALLLSNRTVSTKALRGDLVAVQGIGGLGHLGMQYAKKLGYKGRDSENAALAMKLGANVYIESNATSPAEELLEELGRCKR